MSRQAECPICGAKKQVREGADVGDRTYCRQCWTLMEFKSIQPVVMTKIYQTAEHFAE